MTSFKPALSGSAASLYCDLMEEIKRRSDVIRSVRDLQIPVPQIVAMELCYLQLRMICELIALASLLAHGDVPGAKAKRLTKNYNADQILKSLEMLHPSFYPKPGRQILGANGRPIEILEVTEPHLTKAELQRLYGECGDFLHRGTLNQIMKGQTLPRFERIDEWHRKVATLLNHHQIQLIDPERQLWVLMQGEDGKVHATEFARLEARRP